MKKFSQWFWQKYGDHIVDLWYLILMIFTYSYFVFLNFTFFFYEDMAFSIIGAALTAIYWPALGTYTKLKQVRREFDRREGFVRKKKHGYFFPILWALSALTVSACFIKNGVNWDPDDPILIAGLTIITIAFATVHQFLQSKLIKALELHLHLKIKNSNGNGNN